MTIDFTKGYSGFHLLVAVYLVCISVIMDYFLHVTFAEAFEV